MYQVYALLAVLSLFAFTSTADAAHRTTSVNPDLVGNLLHAPTVSVAKSPALNQLAGHCGGRGYYGRPAYGYGGYHSYRPVYGYGGYGYGNYFNGYYGGYRGGHHHHRGYRGGGGFGLYIGF